MLPRMELFALIKLCESFFEFNCTVGLEQDLDDIFLYGIILSKVSQKIRIQWQDQRDPVAFLKFLRDISNQQPLRVSTIERNFGNTAGSVKRIFIDQVWTSERITDQRVIQRTSRWQHCTAGYQLFQ